MELDQIVIEPLLSEKTNREREQHKYSFRVDPRANKIQIMSAIRQLFNVNPVACNVINVKGKPKRVRYRRGLTSSWKKAVVTLPPNEKIEIFEGA